MPDKIKIYRAEEATVEILESLKKLLPQLTQTAPILTMENLQEIISSKNTLLFLAGDANENGKIVGSLTLVVHRIPSGEYASIEDVVVDREFRRQGIGERLMCTAILRGKDLGLDRIDLTSHPSRKAANRLYRRLGFVLRETNVYSIHLLK